MPSFSKAIVCLMAFASTSSTTTARHVVSKISKKNEAPLVCTWHNFVGSSKYLNCEMVWTEIQIGCGDEDADDTTRMCKYTEHPWNDAQQEEDTDAAAVAAAACVVHGSFDPNTHITTDSATGLCHLNFFPLLLDSCDVDANSSPSGLFGMNAEIHNSRNTENHNKNNSGMLIRFSRTGGAWYYNGHDPRETVPLHGVVPAHRKMLDKVHACKESVGFYQPKYDYCYSCGSGTSLGYCWSSLPCPPKCEYSQEVLGRGDFDCGFACKEFQDKSVSQGDCITCRTSVGTYEASKDYCFACGSGTSLGYCWNTRDCPPKCDGVHGMGGQGDANCGKPCTKFIYQSEEQAIENDEYMFLQQEDIVNPG